MNDVYRTYAANTLSVWRYDDGTAVQQRQENAKALRVAHHFAPAARFALHSKCPERDSRQRARPTKSEGNDRKMTDRKMPKTRRQSPHIPVNHLPVIPFASFAPLRENISSLRTHFRKVCQSEPNRATPAVSPRNSRSRQPVFAVSNSVKPVPFSAKQCQKCQIWHCRQGGQGGQGELRNATRKQGFECTALLTRRVMRWFLTRIHAFSARNSREEPEKNVGGARVL